MKRITKAKLMAIRRADAYLKFLHYLDRREFGMALSVANTWAVTDTNDRFRSLWEGHANDTYRLLKAQSEGGAA